MALILLGKSKCVLCEVVLQKEDRLVATSHFIGDRSDPLWRYSDAPFHYRCFIRWKSRHDFICKFNDIVRKSASPAARAHYMTWDGEILDGTDADVREVRVQSLLILLEELSMRAGCLPLEDLLRGDPKNSGNEEFQKYWEELTLPEHLQVWERRVRGARLNPMAKEWYRHALEDCRKRASAK